MRPYRDRVNEETIQGVRERAELVPIYTFEETAHELAVSRSTVSTYVRTGRATPRYIGAENGRLYFDREGVQELRAVLESRKGAKGE